MKLTAVARLCIGASILLCASSVSAQQLELACPLNWSALADIDAPDQDKIILGIAARDWKLEHLNAMLAKEQECADTNTDSGHSKELMAETVSRQLYPNGLASIQRRDERLALAKEREEQEATRQAAAIAVEQAQAQEAEAAALRAAAQSATSAPAEAGIEQAPEAEPSVPGTQKGDHTLVVGAVALLIVGVVFCWHKFVRNRCKSCGSTSFSRTGETELDRWRGTKQVSEKNSRGTNTRHVQTTYVRLQLDYCCSQCAHEWSKTRKEELGSESSFSRFLAGY